MLRYSRLRTGDCVGLRKERLDGDRLFLRTQKTGESVNRLPKTAVDALRQMKNGRAHFFWTEKGLRESAVADWRRLLRPMIEEAKVTENAHMFRHTFTTDRLTKGVPIEDVAILLGHARPVITAKYYAHFVKARRERLEDWAASSTPEEGRVDFKRLPRPRDYTCRDTGEATRGTHMVECGDAPQLPDAVIWRLGRGRLALAERQAIASRLTALVREDAAPSAIVSRLAAHGLVPLAYRHLVAARDLNLPGPLREELASEFRRHALTRFRFARRLRTLLNILDAAAVDAVPYKGPALAIQLFGNFAMRQFGDLDILVRPSHADRAQRALIEAGLTRHRKSTEGWDDYLYRVRHSSELRDPKESVVVELHWSPADRFLGMDVNVDWLLDETEEIDLLGRPTRVMTRERLLLAMCLHGAKHLWERAVWLAEVAEIVRRSGYVDWGNALSRADHAGFGRAFRAALILVRDLFGEAPPAPWTRALDADLGAVRLAGLLAERLGGAPDRLQGRFRLGYLAQTTVMRRALFCWRVATDLSERDIRTGGPPSKAPLIHSVRRTVRLTRALYTERGDPL
jgi:hypothetical protein